KEEEKKEKEIQPEEAKAEEAKTPVEKESAETITEKQAEIKTSEKQVEVPPEKVPETKEPETKAEETIVVEEKKAEKPEEAEKTEAKKEEKKAPEAKTFVKILDRPRIEIPKPKKPEKKAPVKKARKPGATSRPVPAPGTAPPPAPGKGKKKGKRVVKASDLDSFGKKKKGIRKKGRRESIRRILEEEAGISRVGKKAAKGARAGKEKPVGTAPIKAEKRKIQMSETIQVSELAKRMGVKVGEVIMKLMGLGVMVTANQTIDYDSAALVASEFGYEVEQKGIVEDIITMQEDVKGGKPVPRPPVVAVMGHVDHGKTTLLDAIRRSDVASKEAGGITQHIGAYEVQLPSGNQVVFLDTPGHEAFTSMRARGASVTDMVILVVAADDGVMAQTREAIDHSNAAGVPIIVAVNKIDKPGANPDRVKKELAELGLIPEDWGGETIFVNVSAKQGTGIDELLEMMVLQAEVQELKADAERPAKGRVIESRLDRGRGPVATLLVQEGTLHVGDAIVCGLHYGKVRAMINDKGQKVEAAGPSSPVEVQGLSGVPEAGSEFTVLPTEKKAREVAEYRQRKAREAELAKSTRMSLETVFEKMKEQDLKVLHLLLKADVQGSLEALSDSLRKLSTDKIKVDIVRGGIGAITESDVLLASASDAIIIGFNVKPSPQAKQLADQEHVDIRFYDVIYHAIEEVKSAMTGLLEPVFREKVLGAAEVRQTFHISKVGTIAGCYVTDGVIKRNALARLLRDNVSVYKGKIESLKRFKDDVKEVQAGYECGIGLERFNDIKVGDVIEAFEMEEIAPELGKTKSEQEEEENSSKA
ncbi:MAG: translation initiation factor IF-2, partial [Thermodesulfatator sp.]